MATVRHVLILGCGFTGQRVARALLRAGSRVTATTRRPEQLAELAALGATVHRMEALDEGDVERIPGWAADADAVLCSLPTLRHGEDLVERVPRVVAAIAHLPLRLLYLSTTGVYGSQQHVDEHTLAQPRTARERLRVEAEEAVLACGPNALVLRPAAIYGPGRGVHISMRQGKYRLTGEGGNMISRIHVEDLALHVITALASDVTGAWPVADSLPCTQREMAAFCAELLGLPMPPSVAPQESAETLRANRQVDGSAIRARLGIGLRYPSYREGVLAALREEAGSGVADE